jgi:hypothetical protein
MVKSLEEIQQENRIYNYQMDCDNDKSLPKYNFKNWVKYFAGFSND